MMGKLTFSVLCGVVVVVWVLLMLGCAKCPAGHLSCGFS